MDGIFGANASEAPCVLDVESESLDMYLGLTKNNLTFCFWGEIQDGGSNDGVWGGPVQKDRHVGGEWTGIYNGLEQHRIRVAVGYKYQKEQHSENKNFGPGVLDGTQVEQDVTLTDITGTEYIMLRTK